MPGARWRPPLVTAIGIRRAVRVVAAVCAGLLLVGAAHAPQKSLAFAILEDYDKGEDLVDVAKDFALFRELGVTTWRGSFGWDDFEPERGVYDFDWLHRFADLAAANGITLRPYIGYTPKWAGGGGHDNDDWNDPPRNLDDWYRFTRALASAMRRHPNVASYEIYNEENVAQWWDGTPGEYAAVLRRGAESIREASRSASVLFGGMVFPDVAWLNRICVDGGDARSFDVLPFHAYPETWTPPDVTVENYLGASFESGFVRAADAACGRKPIWINETGYATTDGRTEQQQADWWLRAMATFGAEPRVEALGIYEIKDMRPDRPAIGDTPNYHLGITYVDRKKKMAFSTLERVVRLVGREPFDIGDAALTFEGDVDADDFYRHVFIRRDGHQILFLWTKRRGARVDVTLPRGATRAVEYSEDGTAAGERSIDGRILRNLALAPGTVRLFDLAP